MTHEAVYWPRRIIQGLPDAVFTFQAGMQKILSELFYSCSLLWVDDILGYAPDLETWWGVLSKLLDHLHKHGVKLNPSRCDLFHRVVKWCGRLISEEGKSFDPEYVSSLSGLSRPETAADLQQLRYVLPFHVLPGWSTLTRNCFLQRHIPSLV